MGSDPVGTEPMEIELLRLFVQAMVVDGEIAPSEMDKLRSLANSLGWNEETISRTISEELAQPTNLTELAAAITDPEKRQGAVAACAGIITADGRFEEQERIFLIQLCTAFDFDAQGLVEVIENALASLPAAAE